MDKFIRILFYRLGWFFDFLRYRLLPYGNNRYPHAKAIHEKYLDFIARYAPDVKLRDAVVLDIGSGNMVLQGILFRIFQGVRRYIYAEPFMYFTREHNITIARQELQKNGIDTINIFTGGDTLNSDILEFNTDLCSNLETIPDGSVDLILSNAVFEHIQINDLAPTTDAMWRVLKSGGYMIHEIDLRDHQYYFRSDYAFYRYSFQEWDEITKIANYSVFWSNRLRARDFETAFSERFSVLHTIRYKKEPNQTVEL